LPWLSGNARIPIGIFVGLVGRGCLRFPLVALALSSWVKNETGGSFFPRLFGVFFSLPATSASLPTRLLELQPPLGPADEHERDDGAGLWSWLLVGEDRIRGDYSAAETLGGAGLPSWTALVSLAGFSAISLALLIRKDFAACEVRFV